MVWKTFARQVSVRSSSSWARPLKMSASSGPGHVRDRQEILREHVGDEEALAGGEQLLDRGGHVAVLRHDHSFSS